MAVVIRIEKDGQRRATATSMPLPIQRYRHVRSPGATSDLLSDGAMREIESDPDFLGRILDRLNSPSFISAEDALRGLARD